MSVAANLAKVRESLGSSSVTLIAVSKYVGIEEIKEAFECGVTEFGESRIQDALKKQDAMPPYMAEHMHWHFIGHLQSNKAKKALGRFALIHSVDTQALAEVLSQEAVKMSIQQAVLLQVKVVDDPSKGGFTAETLRECFADLMTLPGIKIEGLMTMTPLTDDRKVWEKCFLGLASLRAELENEHGISLKELSMGMSDDFLDAVKCGATMVRVGRAIFSKN